METGGSLPHSQEPATCPCPQPAQSQRDILTENLAKHCCQLYEDADVAARLSCSARISQPLRN
jgi:hypothetical protein